MYKDQPLKRPNIIKFTQAYNKNRMFSAYINFEHGAWICSEAHTTSIVLRVIPPTYSFVATESRDSKQTSTMLELP